MSDQRTPAPWEANFIGWMKRLRETRGMTQTDLARELQKSGLRFHQQIVARIEAGERPVRLNEAHLIASALGSDLNTMTSAASSDRELRHTVDLLRSGSAEAAAGVEAILNRWLETASPFVNAQLAQDDSSPVGQWGVAWMFKARAAHDGLADAWKALQAISGEGPELHPEEEYEDLSPSPELRDALSAWLERYGLQEDLARAARSSPRDLYAAFPEPPAQNSRPPLREE
ncbi:helix-turn-helix transcriptional regulator [Streptosporangium saharense]|uniref:helix-turn-helix transcriptional regulator n=1 Tax=Streptosporangium saharense TaxID=1706840 RepID=UPI00343AACEA